MNLTPEYLKERLDYNPETGIFTWKERPREYFRTDRSWKMWNTRFPNTTAGHLHSEGYVKILVGGKMRFAHRLAWFLVYGVWPVGVIDHVNRKSSDNSISNLREASFEENSRNSALHFDSRSGIKGVSFSKTRKKWRARLQFNKQETLVGYFEDKEAAGIAIKETRDRLHGEFANHGETPFPVFE